MQQIYPVKRGVLLRKNTVNVLYPLYKTDSWAEPRKKKLEKEKVTKCAKITITSGLDFALNTSIHGVRYVFLPGQLLLERLLWVAVVASSVVAAVVSFQGSLLQFYQEPTLMTVKSAYYRTYNVPFPVVTICNINPVFRSRAKELARTLKDFGVSVERIEELLACVTLLTQPREQVNQQTMRDLAVLQDVLDLNNISISQVANSLSQPCSEMVESCSWNGEVKPCREMFERSLTHYGYCCSFNKRRPSNWTLHPDKDPYRLRSSNYGTGSGLHVLLNPNGDDYLWKSYSVGFAVFVHRSGPFSEKTAVYIGPQSETLLSIDPIVTEDQPDLQTLPPNRRKCMFYNEEPLESTSLYSGDTCTFQCRANALRDLCGCEPYYYVEQVIYARKNDYGKLAATERVPSSCNFRDIRCIKENLRHLNADVLMQKCTCLPRCTVTTHHMKRTSGDFDAVKYYTGHLFNGMNTTGRLSINVFIARGVTTQSRRDVIYTTTELMSKMGGMFSLLLGCSFMTGMEVLDFGIIRIIFGFLENRFPRQFPRYA